MFKISDVIEDTFEVELDIEFDDGSKKKIVLHIKPPKMKMYAKLQRIDQLRGKEFDDFALSVLNNNTDGQRITMNEYGELTTAEISVLLIKYLDWLNSKITADPN